MPSYLTTETSFNWIKINFFAKFSFSLLTSVNFSNILLIGSLFIVIPGKPTDDGFPPITPPLFLNPESRQTPGLFLFKREIMYKKPTRVEGVKGGFEGGLRNIAQAENADIRKGFFVCSANCYSYKITIAKELSRDDASKYNVSFSQRLQRRNSHALFGL